MNSCFQSLGSFQISFQKYENMENPALVLNYVYQGGFRSELIKESIKDEPATYIDGLIDMLLKEEDIE